MLRCARDRRSESPHMSSTIPSLAISTPAARTSSVFASMDGFMWVTMILRAPSAESFSLSFVQFMCPAMARACS